MLAVIRRKRIHEGREDYPGLHRHRQQDGLAKVLEFRFLNLKESRHGGTLCVSRLVACDRVRERSPKGREGCSYLALGPLGGETVG